MCSSQEKPFGNKKSGMNMLQQRAKAFRTGMRGRILIVALLLLGSFTRTDAQGDLLISPLRIVFDGISRKSKEISLANVGKDTATYAISVKDIRMMADGTFEEISEPDSGQRFAGPYMRYFPRKVVLAPNESQVVKLQLIKTSQMTPGEYRSHLYFRAVPDEKPLGEKAKKDTGSISISITPIFGITIPVIIRVGENNAKVSLSDASFHFNEQKKPEISLDFNRTGDMSVYGDMTVDYVSPGGKTSRVKLVKGIGVYTPLTIRHFKVELDNDNHLDFKSGKLHIAYNLSPNEKEPETVETDIVLK